MDITGILKVKSATQQVSEKFTKREFVLTDNSSQYSQHIQFQLTQDKCNILDRYNVGDEIKVHFNIRGREWTSPQGEIKYFNTLEAWRMEGNGTGQTTQQERTAEKTVSAKDESDDLPF